MSEMIDSTGRELRQHGSYEFPCNSYQTAGGGFPWHWHDEMEMIYVESGTLVFAAANQRYTLHAGDGFIVNCNVPHAIDPQRFTKYEESDIVFHPRLLYGSVDTTLWDKYFRRFLQGAAGNGFPLLHSDAWQSAASEGILRACQAFRAKAPMYEFVVREELTRTYLAVWEHVQGQLETDHLLSSKRDDRIKTMMRYLESNMDMDVSLKDLAAFAKLSPRACQREFQTYLGMTPLQYLTQMRLSKATDLLRSGNLSITEVGFQCGFQDASYFAKQFRLRYGMSPRQYQAKE